MKSLIAGLLLSAPLLANAYTWTDTDPYIPVLVTPKTSFEYTFNPQNAGFNVGTDTVSSYDLDFDIAVLNPLGKIVGDFDILFDGSNLGGIYHFGKVALNKTGELGLEIDSLQGNFYIEDASLTAHGTKSSASVPEPTSLPLLAVGILGIVVLRRKSTTNVIV